MAIIVEEWAGGFAVMLEEQAGTPVVRVEWIEQHRLPPCFLIEAKFSVGDGNKTKGKVNMRRWDHLVSRPYDPLSPEPDQDDPFRVIEAKLAKFDIQGTTYYYSHKVLSLRHGAEYVAIEEIYPVPKAGRDTTWVADVVAEILPATLGKSQYFSEVSRAEFDLGDTLEKALFDSAFQLRKTGMGSWRDNGVQNGKRVFTKSASKRVVQKWAEPRVPNPKLY